jgi:predicted CoA-binding protein
VTDLDELRPLLEDATTIELVDWPDPGVPAALLRTGYTVLGHEPDGYKEYEIVAAPPVDPGDGRTFPLGDGTLLLSRPVETMPEVVHIVNVFRPPEEQLHILQEAARAGVRVFWVHPGIPTAPGLAAVAEEHRMILVDGVSIVDAVRELL